MHTHAAGRLAWSLVARTMVLGLGTLPLALAVIPAASTLIRGMPMNAGAVAALQLPGLGLRTRTNPRRDPGHRDSQFTVFRDQGRAKGTGLVNHRMHVRRHIEGSVPSGLRAGRVGALASGAIGGICPRSILGGGCPVISNVRISW